VIHAAESRALAGLEYLVHSARPPTDLVLVAVDVPEGAPIELPKLSDLPADWASPLPSKHCQAWGEKWCRTGAALALAVPSVIVHEERNYVINVAHPRMGEVKLKPIRRFAFDPRLYVRERRLV
jgi:RES domain-containing protein